MSRPTTRVVRNTGGGQLSYDAAGPVVITSNDNRPRRSRKTGRKRRWIRRLIVLLALVGGVCWVLQQANSSGGAETADLLRRVFGAKTTARIEAAYLDLVDKVQSVRYQVGGDRPHAPWALSVTPSVTPINGVAAGAPGTTPTAVTAAAGTALPDRTGTPPIAGGTVPAGVQATVPTTQTASGVPVDPPPVGRQTPLAQPTAGPSPMPLTPVPVIVKPALDGEGIWTTAGLPDTAAGSLPPVAKMFLRPDPSRPWALATILQFDLRVASLHVVPGISEPGGPVGHAGTGQIPASDAGGGKLLAVFNGGFKYADGAYGLMTGGTVYVAPVWGAATIAVTQQGTVFMGRWGIDHRLVVTNHTLIAWRQNAGLLIDRGRVTAETQNGSSWGLSILNDTHTWRSGVGITRRGTVVYVSGNALSAVTLARALGAAGAVTAMELDINPFWVRAYTYSRDGSGALVASRLDPSMPGTGMEYLYGHVRDFFYVTRRTG